MRYCKEIGFGDEFAKTIWEEEGSIRDSNIENEILNPLVQLLNI